MWKQTVDQGHSSHTACREWSPTTEVYAQHACLPTKALWAPHPDISRHPDIHSPPTRHVITSSIFRMWRRGASRWWLVRLVWCEHESKPTEHVVHAAL